MENSAPIRKQSAVSHPLGKRKPISKNSAHTKNTRILYSLNKNAFAPDEIASAISFILSFPAGFLLIITAIITAKINATAPATGAIIVNFSIVSTSENLLFIITFMIA